MNIEIYEVGPYIHMPKLEQIPAVLHSSDPLLTHVRTYIVANLVYHWLALALKISTLRIFLQLHFKLFRSLFWSIK